MNPFAISSLFVTVMTFPLGIFLLVGAKGKRPNIAFAWVCLFATVWGLGGLIGSTTKDYDLAYLGWRIANIGSIMIPVTYYHFVYSFFELKQKYLIRAVYCLAVFYLYINFFQKQFFFGGVSYMFDQFYYIDGRMGQGFLYLSFYLLFFCALLLYSFSFLVVNYFRTDGVRKQQIKLFIIASVIAWVGGHGDFPAAFGYPLYPYPNFLVAIYPFAIAYAIVQYQFMDIIVIIKKSIVYTVLIATVTGFYMISVLIFERFFQNVLGYNSTVFSVVTILLIAVMFAPLKNWIQELVDKTFFKRTALEMAQENEMLRQEVSRSERYKTLASLTSGIVDEIKNPLTALKGYAHFFKQKKHDEEFLAKFEQILDREINKIDLLTKHLTEYSNPSSLSAENISILRLLNETISLLKSQINEQKIELATDFPKDGNPELYLDPSQIRQTLSNVMMNAIEAMPNGGQLFLRTEQTATHVRIIIRDSGYGIPKSEINKIFDPFYSTKGHTGLGLSITQGIIENHHGKIRVRSEEGKGAEFVIELPLNPVLVREALKMK